MQSKEWWREYNKKRKDYCRQYYMRNREKARQYCIDNHDILAKKRTQKKIDSGWQPKTDWLYTIKQCRICKKGSQHLIKLAKTTTGKQYYICRTCNNVKAKKYYKAHKSKVYQIVKKSEDKYPQKKYARRQIRNQIKNGSLVKPQKCQDCGVNNVLFDAHHPDYSKPLKIIWLCRACHTKCHQ